MIKFITIIIILMCFGCGSNGTTEQSNPTINRGLTNALIGAAAGAPAGPIGMAVGTGVGFVSGLFAGASEEKIIKEQKELEKKFEKKDNTVETLETEIAREKEKQEALLKELENNKNEGLNKVNFDAEEKRLDDMDQEDKRFEREVERLEEDRARRLRWETEVHHGEEKENLQTVEERTEKELGPDEESASIDREIALLEKRLEQARKDGMKEDMKDIKKRIEELKKKKGLLSRSE